MCMKVKFRFKDFQLYTMRLQELRDLMKQHNIKGSSYLNKPAIVSLLIEKGILDSNILLERECAKRELEEMRKHRAENDERYQKLLTIRTNSKRVEILDRETGEVITYPSLYKAGQAFGFRAKVMSRYNGKQWQNRYEIKVCD